MEFRSTFTSVRLLDEHAEDFHRFMAVRVRKHSRYLDDPTEFALNDAIREHPDWFDVFLSNPKLVRKFNTVFSWPEQTREKITCGLSLMEVTA